MMKHRIVVAGMPQAGTTMLYNVVNFILRLNGINVVNALYHPTEYYKKVVNEDYLRRFRQNTPQVLATAGVQPAVLLIKEHHHAPFLSEWAELIFVMKRDIRHSISSRRRRGRPLLSKGKHIYSVPNPLDPGGYLTYRKYNPDTFDGFKRWCEYLVDDCCEDWLKDTSGPQAHLVDYEEYRADPEAFVESVFNEMVPHYDGLKLDVPKISHTLNTLGEHDKNITFFSKDKITNQQNLGGPEKHLSTKEIEHIDKNYKNWIKEEK